MDDEYFCQVKTEFPPAEQERLDKQCNILRINFIKNWVLNANLDLYKTDTERDWAYIVRKEYRYIVKKSIFEGIGIACLFQVLDTIRLRKVQFYAYLFVPAFAVFSYYRRIGTENRRLFEILNVGTEYELGAERNRVLEECNRIAKRNDF